MVLIHYTLEVTLQNLFAMSYERGYSLADLHETIVYEFDLYVAKIEAIKKLEAQGKGESDGGYAAMIATMG